MDIACLLYTSILFQAKITRPHSIQVEEEECVSAINTQIFIETVRTECNSGAQSVVKEKTDLLKMVTEARKKKLTLVSNRAIQVSTPVNSKTGLQLYQEESL